MNKFYIGQKIVAIKYHSQGITTFEDVIKQYEPCLN